MNKVENSSISRLWVAKLKPIMTPIGHRKVMKIQSNIDVKVSEPIEQQA